MCVGTCTAQPEARSAGDEARQAGSPAQPLKREGSLEEAGHSSYCRCTGGAIACMTKIAGTLTLALCEMLRVICYKQLPKSPQKRKTSKTSHRHKQLQVVTLGPMLLGSLGACVSHALHPAWQAASH